MIEWITRRRVVVMLALWLAARCVAPATARAAEPAQPNWRRAGQEAVRLLAQYIQIDTQNPPGRTVESVEFLDPLLRRAGFETERITVEADKPMVIGRLRGRGQQAKPIVLLHHMDVSPVGSSTWTSPPLSGAVRDGTLYGRGALDTKSFGIIQILALQLLADSRIRPTRDIVFLAVPDKEVGGGSGMKWISTHRPDLMAADAVWHEGGYGLTDAFPSPVPPVLLVAVTEKKALGLRLVADGPGGPAPLSLAETAPFRLQQALERIFDHLPPPRLTSVPRRTLRRIGATVGGVRGFVMRNADNPVVWPFVRAMLQRDPTIDASVRDTITLTMLRAGDGPGMVPEHAEAVLDCRLLPRTDEPRFLAELERTINDPHVRLDVIRASTSTAASSTKHPLFKAMESAAQRVYPSTILAPFMAITPSDARYFRQQKVPAFGFVPILIPQELLATIHGTDERIPVDSIAPAIQVVYETLGAM